MSSSKDDGRSLSYYQEEKNPHHCLQVDALYYDGENLETILKVSSYKGLARQTMQRKHQGTLCSDSHADSVNMCMGNKEENTNYKLSGHRTEYSFTLSTTVILRSVHLDNGEWLEGEFQQQKPQIETLVLYLSMRAQRAIAWLMLAHLGLHGDTALRGLSQGYYYTQRLRWAWG